MLLKSLFLTAVLGLSLSVVQPASAQGSRAVNSARIEVLERQVTMLRTRLGMNPPAPEEAAPSGVKNPQLIADMSAKIGTLEGQIRKLTGRLELFEHRQRQMQTQIDLLRKEMEFARSSAALAAVNAGAGGSNPDTSKDISASAVGVGAKTAASASAASGTKDTASAAGSGQALAPIAEAKPVATVELPDSDAAGQFDYAFAFVRKNDLVRGRLALEAFLEANKGDSRAANAKYWLGRIHLQEGRNAKAAQYLLELIEGHPNHPKRADALVDLADVLLKLGSADDACNALAEFRRVEDKASARLIARANRVGATARCQ